MRTFGILVVLAVVGCSSAAQPTPQIIFVTSPPVSVVPSGVPAPSGPATPFVVYVTPQPTRPATTPGPTGTPRPATPAPLARLDVEILDSGFAVVDEYISYAIVARNPNLTTHVASYLPLQITFYDGDTILITAEENMSVMLPGQTSATTGFDEITGRPTRMEVRMGSTDWEEIDFSAGRFVVSDVQTKPEQFGGWKTTGTIQSEFVERQESVRIDVVHRNSAGDVIGGDFTFLDFIDPGTRIGFDVSTTLDLKDVDREATEVYWSI